MSNDGVVREGTMIQMSKRLDSMETVLRMIQQSLAQVARTEEKVANLLQKTMEHDSAIREVHLAITSIKDSLITRDKADIRTGLWIEILKKGMLFIFIMLAGYVGSHPEQATKAIEIMVGAG